MSEPEGSCNLVAPWNYVDNNITMNSVASEVWFGIKFDQYDMAYGKWIWLINKM